jgi:hypothetical protein
MATEKKEDKNKKKEKKPAKKKGLEDLGEPIDLKGVAGGVCHAEPAPSKIGSTKY